MSFPRLEWLTMGRSFGVPHSSIAMVAVAAVTWVVLHRSVFGRHLLAVGKNQEAARYSGIATHRVSIAAYVICTVQTAVSAIFFAMYTRSIPPSSHGNFHELYAIAAAVLGGCSLRGGEGSIIGVVPGTLLLEVLQNLVNLRGIPSSLNFAVMGSVILIGVLADQQLSNRRMRVGGIASASRGSGRHLGTSPLFASSPTSGAPPDGDSALPRRPPPATQSSMTTHRFHPSAWHNVLGTLPPALTVASGDTVVTETIDAHGFDRDGVRRAPDPNPMNGPIAVAGAEQGDALKVEILGMTPIRAGGWTRASLAANVVDPEFVRGLPPRDRADWRIDLAALTATPEPPVPGLEHLVLPLEPMIGCFGVAPPGGQAFSTATSAENGGNMDYRGFGPGSTVWFPVAVPGALFFLGDCHATQGDGEIVGTGIETCFEVTVRLTVEKGRALVWPRGESATDIFSVGNARPLDQALQHATTDMFRWLTEGYGLSPAAASHLMGQVVRYDVGNVFDPAYTMVCRIAKRWLPPLP